MAFSSLSLNGASLAPKSTVPDCRLLMPPPLPMD